MQAFITSALECPRCKKNEFALFKERYRFVCFCLDGRCLSLDKEASLAKKNGRPIPESGMAETGAQRYHLGRSYHEAVLSKWIGGKEEHRKVSEWLKNQKPFLVVLGSPGTGKTYLAAALLNHLFEKGEEVGYVTHRKFIEEIHFAIQNGHTQHSVLPRYCEKKYLIIDDLGSATCTEWQQEMILELIDRRYSEKQKTIITSNFNKIELKQKLGDRTASRLLDLKNELLEFWSTDRRSDVDFDPEKHWTDKD